VCCSRPSNGGDSDRSRVEKELAITVIRLAKRKGQDDRSDDELRGCSNGRDRCPSSDHRSGDHDGKEQDDRRRSDESVTCLTHFRGFVLKREGGDEVDEEGCDHAQNKVHSHRNESQSSHSRSIGLLPRALKAAPGSRGIPACGPPLAALTRHVLPYWSLLLRASAP
jgi:hypothetical protein